MRTKEELAQLEDEKHKKQIEGSVWEMEVYITDRLRVFGIGYWLSTTPMDNKLLEKRIKEAGWEVHKCWILRWIK